MSEQVPVFTLVKVRARYSEQYDFEAITNLLGMGKPTTKVESTPSKSRFIPSL